MLTPKQYELLQLLKKRIDETGVPPSFDEMKDALGLKSKSGIHRLVSALEERGFIRRLAHRARAIEILRMPNIRGSGDAPSDKTSADILSFPGKVGEKSGLSQNPNPMPSDNLRLISRFEENRPVSLPLYGKIAAGTPIDALRDTSSFIDIPPQLLGRGEYYALEVEGDSMIDAGILDGDTVVIERCEKAENNNIVVALVDQEEATLKQIVYDKDAIILIPANSSYLPKRYTPDRVQIQGRLISLLRRYP